VLPVSVVDAIPLLTRGKHVVHGIDLEGRGAKAHRVIVDLGDERKIGLGRGPDDRRTKALQAKGIAVEMSNAGVSGDTSSGGRDRLRSKSL
jgi:hypothetical protein